MASLKIGILHNDPYLIYKKCLSIANYVYVV